MQPCTMVVILTPALRGGAPGIDLAEVVQHRGERELDEVGIAGISARIGDDQQIRQPRVGFQRAPELDPAGRLRVIPALRFRAG